MQFKDVVGQKELKAKLIGTVNENRISHAQLFLGKAGAGSLAMALAYAQYIQCENRQSHDSCGSCNSCRKMMKLIHPDLHFAFPVNTNKEIKSKPLSDHFINEWREIVNESPYFTIHDWHKKINIESKQSLINVHQSQEIIKKLSFKTYEAPFKILFIWHADSLNVQAANKLLKLIEEPTDRTILILIAEEEEQLLKTITSRTQTIRIPAISTEEVQEYIIKNWELYAEQSLQIAHLSEGDLIAAKERVQQSEESEAFFELFKQWMRACYEADIEKINRWVEEVSGKSLGREKQKRFLQFALEIMREAAMRSYAGHSLSRFQGVEEKFIQKFTPFIHENNLLEVVELLETAGREISRNAYSKIVFMDISLRFANLLRVKKRTFVH